MKKHDALIQIRFFTTAEGGRKSDLFARHYGCPIFIDGYDEHGFDCRFMLDTDTHLELGMTHNIKIKFLNPELALAQFKEVASISLWEGRTIAVGHILKA